MEALKKKRSAAQGAFSRIFNGFMSVVADPDLEPEHARGVAQELEQKFSALELVSNEIYAAAGDSEDDKALWDTAETSLDEAYLKLQKAKVSASKIVRDAEEAQGGYDLGGVNVAPLAHPAADGAQVMANAIIAASMMPNVQPREFTGDPRDYTSFISFLETHVEGDIKDFKKCLSFMIRCCKGAAYDVVACYDRMCIRDPENAYMEAKQALKEHFGAEHVIVTALTRDCTDGPVLKFKDIAGLKDLCIKL